MNLLQSIFFFTVLIILFTTNTILCDTPRPWQIGFQDPATPIMEGIIDFHNHLMFFLILILILVCWILANIISRFSNNQDIAKFSHAALLEIVWTLIPTIILMIIAVPSFSLLYSLEYQVDPRFTVKVIGHQWYWSYEYSDFIVYNMEVQYDSYIVEEADLNTGSFRLLEVYTRLALPAGEHIRLLVTSQDVIHSWAVPSFGIKMDAIPGRINQVFCFIKRTGLFYGQCSEICGVNHGFMPICVAVMTPIDFAYWVSTDAEYCGCSDDISEVFEYNKDNPEYRKLYPHRYKS